MLQNVDRMNGEVTRVICVYFVDWEKAFDKMD